MIATPLVQQGLLRRITFESLKPVRTTMYLTVKSDLVRQTTFLRVKGLLQEALLSGAERP